MHRSILSSIAAGLLLLLATPASAIPILEVGPRVAPGGPAVGTLRLTHIDHLERPALLELRSILAQHLPTRTQAMGTWREHWRKTHAARWKFIASKWHHRPKPSDDSVNSVPEPGPLPMLGLGLVGLAVSTRRRYRRP